MAAAPSHPYKRQTWNMQFISPTKRILQANLYTAPPPKLVHAYHGGLISVCRCFVFAYKMVLMSWVKIPGQD